MAQPSRGMRLSDAERQVALEVLGEHFAQGRLTREELDERSDAVWSAKTDGDLSPLFADLPVEAPATAGRRGSHDGPRRHPARGLLVPLLVVLVAITVVTHLPFVLLALALWVVLGHRRWHAHHHAHHPHRLGGWQGQAIR